MPPELIAEIKYLTWTDDMRQVVYLGFLRGHRRGAPLCAAPKTHSIHTPFCLPKTVPVRPSTRFGGIRPLARPSVVAKWLPHEISSCSDERAGIARAVTLIRYHDSEGRTSNLPN